MNWIKAEKQFILGTYKRQPLIIVKAEGSFVWDIHNKKYLDFFSGLGVNNIGHCHPAVIKAVTSQVKRLIHTSNLYYTLPQIRCAQELLKRTFPGKVFFSNSGAEANECAIKLARRWGKKVQSPLLIGGQAKSKVQNRYEIIAFENCFHGRTMATLSLTNQKKYRKGFKPFLEKVLHAKFNDIESVKKLVSKKTCVVFIEPIQGEGGVNPAQKDFLKDLRKLCDQNKLLLVFDEVQCGLGRSGKLFCYQHYGVTPDVLVIAKGFGGGLPIGATIAKNNVAKLFAPGDHASTFGGNPVICSAAEQVLKTMNHRLLENVRKKGNFLISRLKNLERKFPSLIEQVRGVGLMIGIELKVPGEPFVKFFRDKGLLINCTQDKVLRLLPPLTVSVSEMETALDLLEQSFSHPPY